MNMTFLCSQLQMLESVHRPIALKSSLSGGILESMCAMDCAPSVRAVLSPLSGSAFLQVTPLFCLIVYQIALQNAGVAIPPPSLAIGCRPSLKWLNIVLDLNGVLCQCVERPAAARHGRSFFKDQHLYSSRVPTLVGPKGVYCRPRVRKFLRLFSNFAAHIVIWSSMKRTTVERVARYHFHDLPPPFAILGQNHCKNIEIGDGQFVLSFNENKLIFLKVMPEQLFNRAAAPWPFNNDNTVLVDDSPEKSVCNESGNAIFLESWSRHEPDNNFLVDTLAPWLERMSLSCMPGQIREYVDKNRIGSPPLAADDPLLLHMMRGMAFSAKNVGVHYNVIGVPDLNCT